MTPWELKKKKELLARLQSNSDMTWAAARDMKDLLEAIVLGLVTPSRKLMQGLTALIYGEILTREMEAEKDARADTN